MTPHPPYASRNHNPADCWSMNMKHISHMKANRDIELRIARTNPACATLNKENYPNHLFGFSIRCLQLPLLGNTDFTDFLNLPGLCYRKIYVGKIPLGQHKKLLRGVTLSGTGSAKKRTTLVKLIPDVKRVIHRECTSQWGNPLTTQGSQDTLLKF